MPETDLLADMMHPEPNLAGYIRTVARSWRTVAVTTVAVVAAMIVYLNVATYKYTAAVKLTTTPASGGIGSQLGSLSTLASLGGVRLPQGSGEQNFLNFSQSLLSRSTAEALLARPDLLHVMFDREWDPSARRWVEPHGIVKSVASGGRALLGLPVFPYRSPDAARIQEFLEKNVGVAEDTRKPVISMSLSHRDPVFAAKLLGAITSIDDENLRRRSLIRARDYIAYLEGQLRVVQLAESRTALAVVLGEQEKLRMLASARAPFAAEPISAIGVSDQPTSPKPILFLFGAVFAGLVLGGLLALVRANFRAAPGFPPPLQ